MSRCEGAGPAALLLSLALAACSSTSSSMKEPADATSAPPGPCEGMAFDDRSAAGADRTVSFGGAGGSDAFSYAPMCMQVAAGQKVTFSGDFSVHPLAAGLAPGQTGTATSGNPIPDTSSGTSPVTATFAASGTFPYFCRHHYAAGMIGEVVVK